MFQAGQDFIYQNDWHFFNPLSDNAVFIIIMMKISVVAVMCVCVFACVCVCQIYCKFL